jgi:hypothetical protein
MSKGLSFQGRESEVMPDFPLEDDNEDILQDDEDTDSDEADDDGADDAEDD